MSTVALENMIHSKLQRINHKDKRHARLKLEFFEAQGQCDLVRINSELNEIIDEIEKKEVEEFA